MISSADATQTVARAAARTAGPLLPELLEVARNARETHDTFTLRLRTEGEGGRPFLPGQFNMLSLFGAGEAPISISGDPARPEELVHTIRVVGPLTRALCAQGRGASVAVRGPFGTGWPMELIAGRDVVIVAGGIGLAPLRPAIHQILRRRDQCGRVVLLYGARTARDLLYAAELERWRGRFDLDVEVTVDQADRDWYGRAGVVTAMIPGAGFDGSNAVALVCGPEVMMRYTVRELAKRGLGDDRIYLSMERSMRCGIGHCGHCQLGPHFVCLDGPVFRLDNVRRLLTIREM